MNKSHELLILGFGGHARSVADIALACGYKKLLFLDAAAREGEHFLNFPVYSHIAENHWQCFLAAGDNYRREEQMHHAVTNEWSIETLFSPHAYRGVGSEIGRGTLVAHHAHIGPVARIGDACIINTAAIIEHECDIGDFSHVSVNATLAGGVVLGRKVLIGVGATVRNGVTICDQTVIAAGATVVCDISEPGIYVGTPARLMKKEVMI